MEPAWIPYIGTEPYLFISYSHEDWNQVSSVLDALHRKGFRFWLDRGIQAGDAWTATVSERLANCAVLLAFLSPAFIKSPNCLREVRTADSIKTVVTVPLWLEKMNRAHLPCEWIFLLNKAQELRLDQYPNPDAFAERLLSEKRFTPCRLAVSNVSFAAPVRRLARNVGQAAVGPSPAFVGRGDRMAEIEAAFRNGANAVNLYGMGGIGKSEICRKLFQTYTAGAGTDMVKSVLWVTWRGAIENTFYMQFPHITEKNAERQWRQARAYIREQGRNLLVFMDNADTLRTGGGRNDAEALSNLGCRVLLTSRTRWEDFYPVYADNLTPEQCRTLYRRSLRNHRKRSDADMDKAPDPALDEILRLADYHALTVHLLAKTQRAADMSYTELLEKLRQSKFDLADVEEEIFYAPGAPGSADGGAEQTFAEHMARIFDLSSLREVKDGADALRVLQGMSLMAPNAYIPVKNVRKWLALPNLKGLNRAADAGWLNERTEMEDGSRSVAIHPAVAAAVRYADGPDAAYTDAVAGRLFKDMLVEATESFVTKLPVLEHAFALERVARTMDLRTENYAGMLHQIGYLLTEKGDYSAALEWLEKALSIRESVLGTEHPDTASTYNRIGFAFHCQRDYASALKWYRKTLTIREKVLGTEHPRTASIYNDIAGAYVGMGEYAVALEWYQKALHIREKAFGTQYPKTATIYNNIGCVYRELGNYPVALEWMRKALSIREETLGTDHPNTAAAYFNIGTVYYGRGQYGTALEWLEKAYAVRLKVLGPEHPDTKLTRTWIDNVNQALRPSPDEKRNPIAEQPQFDA